MLQDKAATEDYFLGGRVKLAQPVSGFRAAIDSVLLAAAVLAKPGDSVLELGTGPGAAILCLAARVPGLQLSGIERDSAAAALCRYNAQLNGCDLTVYEILVGEDSQLKEFDHVFANPPFHDAQSHGAGPKASHMPDNDNIANWIAYADRHLKSHGSLTLIHRADAMPRLLSALQDCQFGAIKVLPVQSRGGQAAKRILLKAVKHRRTPFELLSPFIVHEEHGDYTPRCHAILREGAALDF